MNKFGVDDVNGTVIGKVCAKKDYSFWRNGRQLIPSERFSNDADAIKWVKRVWPMQFAKGLEMRVYG